MKKIKKITKISLALLVISASTTVSAKIYKWIDDEGQMHYTQRPAPAGKDATDIEQEIRHAADLPTSSSSKAAKAKVGKYGTKPAAETKNKDPEKKEVAEKRSEDDKQAENSVAEYEKKLKEYCEKQTANLDALNSDTPIAWQDEGKTKLLSNSERKDKIESIQTSIEENCKAKPKDE